MAKKCLWCLNLRNVTLSYGIISLMLSVATMTITVTTLFHVGRGPPRHESTPLVVLLVHAIVHILASLLCIQGACSRSRQYLLPWIFATAIAVVSAYVVGVSSLLYTPFVTKGIILILAGTFFFVGWICVMTHYYELCEQSFSRERQAHNNPSGSRLGAGSLPTISSVAGVEETRIPPPPYSVVYYNPAFEEDKPPSYEDIGVTGEAPQRNQETATVTNERY